jgi:hypothetical protein
LNAAQDNEQWARVLCAIVSAMASNAEGVRYLATDKLLRQIAECFIQLDPVRTTVTF